MNNILVTGSNGQLGSEIREISKNYPNFNFLFTDVKQLDITNYKAVASIIELKNIDIIINCAAYTAVDKAESEPDLCDSINHLAVANFAQLAKDKNIKLIHISTDYVFDGRNNKPYTESDNPNPKSVYGKTKLDGELALKRINPSNSIIIRTSWVYSKFGNNFVKTILNLAKTKNKISVVYDQVGSPTNAFDLANVILKITPKINNSNVEIYHFSNTGECSWFEFAEEIFKIQRKRVYLESITSIEFETAAERPDYSVLNSKKIADKYDLKIYNWKSSLSQFFIQTPNKLN